MKNFKKSNDEFLINILIIILLLGVGIGTLTFGISYMSYDVIYLKEDNGSLSYNGSINVTGGYLINGTSIFDLTNVSGNVSETDTLQTVTNRGSTTTNNISIDDGGYFIGDGSLLTNIPSVWTDNGSNVYVEDREKVGIGVVPTYSLDIYTDEPSLRIRAKTVNTNATLQLMERADLGAEIKYTGASNNNLQFNMDSGTGMDTKMELNRDSGNLNVLSTISVGDENSVSAESVIEANVYSDNEGILIKRQSTGIDAYAGLMFSPSSVSNYIKGAIYYQRTGGAGIGDLVFAINNQVSSANVDIDDRVMTLKNTGRLGLGTSNPSAKLDVNGSAIIDGNLNVNGNLNVTGCICYDGGSTCLGTCI